MKFQTVALFASALLAYFSTSYAQTVHQVCISEVFSTGACNNANGVFSPPNLTIQQGDQIQFTTHLIAIFGYNGTHDIQFDGSPANNVMLTISTNVLNPITTVTTPPFNTPGTFPMECHNGAHCFNFAETLEGWSCDGYSVTVLPNCTIDADFSASSLNICEGESVTFTNNSVDYSTSEWKIDENSEATTTDLTYTFADSGSFDVELVVEDGNCADSMTVTVNVAPVPNVDVQVTPTSTPINTPVSVDVTLSDTLPGSSYSWDFCNMDTDNGTVDFNYSWDTPGTYCVCLTVDNNNGCATTESCVDPVTVTNVDNSSIEDEQSLLGLEVYPNPSNGAINLKANHKIIHILLIDIQGKTVKEIKELQKGQEVLVKDLNTGTYVLKYTSNGSVQTNSIIVQ